MFDTILIANRGEIACRVMATAHRMGVACVAVYSDADAGAKHVMLADRAVHIGGNAPADSYLRGDAIIQAALDTGAQAIHPGYGFLSENPAFVEAVEAAGLVFIGPSAQAIRSMGLKDAAKALMEASGVPVVPGYHGSDQEAGVLAQAADKIGYPVLIKAVAGGGGKGMRLVAAPQDFAAALDAARREAKGAFGNDDVLVEKYVSKPRHIEVQVFGDGQDAVHLFERDCSLQRRHQKVIEEAPAPGMTQDMRYAMGAAAVRAAQAIGYKGAGTIEFIVDASEGLRRDRFFFMEMNTRLQVEHPVTEMITGVDLVEWQLRVAAEETLQSLQPDLQIDGHAFEARIYAEDAANDFLPVTGRLDHVSFPPLARVESGVRAGDDISPFYDPMIAKIVVAGPTRAVALARLRQALAETQIAGTCTNLSFLSALAAQPDFVSGDVDTGLIARALPELIAQSPANPAAIIAAGQAEAGLRNPSPLAGFALWRPNRRQVHLSQAESALDLGVEVQETATQTWWIEGTTFTVENRAGVWFLGAEKLPETHCGARTITVFGQAPITFERVDLLAQASASQSDSNTIEAPMPGLVKAIFAKSGQSVCKGDALAVLEAMKMEHTLTAPRDGILSEVLVTEGDQVSAGAALIALETQS